MDCLFCKIVSREIPSNVVYETDDVLAFYDIEPQAPEHIVIVPKSHIESANGIDESNVKYIACNRTHSPVKFRMGYAPFLLIFNLNLHKQREK